MTDVSDTRVLIVSASDQLTFVDLLKYNLSLTDTRLSTIGM